MVQWDTFKVSNVLWNDENIRGEIGWMDKRTYKFNETPFRRIEGRKFHKLLLSGYYRWDEIALYSHVVLREFDIGFIATDHDW